MTVFAPPGGLEGRAVVPAEGEMGGEDGGGELWEGGKRRAWGDFKD